MDRTSLVSFGGQLVVVGLDGKLRTLIENEQPLQGEVIVARNDAEPIGLNVQLVKENGVQDVSDDVAQILGALEAGQDPTQLGDEFASAAGQSDGSSLQTSGTVDRIGAELLADTGFETIGLESLGFSQTQILSLNELYLNTLRGNETSPAVEPAAPVAGDDIVQTDEDSAIIIDVLANDEDADSENLFIESVTVPEEQGTVEIEDGKLIFTPAEDFNGDADITYVVSDGELEDEASVTVTVNPLNDAPVANDDSAVTDEDTPVTINVLPNDTDIDGDTLSIVNASVPDDQGTVEIVDGKLVFTPAENFNGEANINYTVSDGELEDSAEVTVTVNPINDAPVANDDNVVTDEDTPVAIDVLPNDTDVDGDTLTIVNASVPADQGTVEIVDGKLVFTPADNFNGEATISYTVSDGELEDSAEVSVTVNPINDAPVANDDSAVTDEDTPVTIDVLPNDTDVDGDTLTIVNASVPVDQGTVEIVDGKLVFTPAENFNGEANINYTVSDGELEDSAEVSITVNPINDAPVANDDNAVTDEDTPVAIDVLPNDTDVDGDTLTIVNASVPVDQGTVEIVDGKLVFTPADNFNGEATISYTVSDGELEDSAEVSVTVNPINDAPVANDDNVVTDEDTPVTINVLPNDTDVDGDTLTIVSASVPADQGTVEIVDGKLVFTPAENFNGEATISYTVSDGELEDEAQVSVTVNPINDAPVANNDSAVTDEDTPVTINVLPNDTDVDGDTLTIVNASVPADQGTVEIVDGKLVFTPADNFNGEATISYTVSDGELEDDAQVSVTVNPLNDAPVANDDNAVTDEDTPVTINVLPNDTDVDGDTLTIVNASVPADQGMVEIVDGKLVFTPAENFNGEATISYTVSDGALEDSAEVSVTVNPINDAPVANDDSAATDEDTPLTIDVLPNDTDIDGDTLTIVNASVPADQGTVEIVDGKLIFTPADNFNGEATISYTVSDGVLEDSAEVSVTVNPINDAPVANDDSAVTDEDTPVTIDVLPNDTDIDGDTLTIVNASVPADQGMVEIVDGKLVFTPAENFNGEATISYTVSDGALEDSAEVSVTVNPINDAPVANDDSAATDEDTPLTIDVLPNDTDIDGDTLTIVNASVPADQGTVEIVDGKLIFTPADNFNGEATISYTVSDGVLEDSAEVSVTVNPINDAPVANDDSAVTDEDTPVTIDVLPNDTDIDGDTLTIVNASVPADQGTVEIVDGKLVFTPAENFNGEATISYTVSDGELEDSAEVTVTVNPINDAPVANDDNVVTDEDTPVTINVLPNDTDVDGDTLTIVNASVPTDQGTVEIVDGKLVFTPAENFNGEATISYTVSDGELEDSAEVSVTVNPINDAPVANDDNAVTDEDTPVTIDVLTNDTDVDGDTLTIVNASVPVDQGTVEIVDGKLVFTPAENFNGEATISYTVSDGELEDSAEVTVTVNPINDAPVANDDNAVTDEDTPVTINVLPNDTDVDGDTLTIVNASVPAEQGTVEIVDGKLVFTPAENFNGEATISYTVSDGVLEDSAEVSVTVNPINDVPTVENTIADQSLEEDFTPYTIDLNDAFSDVDNVDGELTFSVSGNSNIQVSIVDGIATITPTADWNGSEELTFTAEDPSGETVSQVVDFTVAAVVDIVSDSADIVEDTPTKLDVLGNDNFEGDAPVVSVEAGHEPTNGTVVVNNDGTITYTPNQDYNGPDQFTYTVTSGGVTETTTVTLNVTPVNDKPVVENTIAGQSLEEDFTPYTIDLNEAFSDIDNADGELTFSVSGNSNIQVSIVDGIATITPTADWNGSEELTFTAEDPSGETVSQVVDFTVAAVADIVSDSADIVEDTPTKLDVLGNDNFEGDAPVVTVEAGHEPTNGTVVVNDDGTITYTPNQDYNGPDQFTYTVSSGGVTETTTVTLNVTPVNDKPVVENTIADQSLEEDFTPYTIDLNDAFSDVDNADGELTFSVSGNSNIQVSIVDGIATITPTADWNGSEELTFTAEDPSGETVSQVVDFTVAAVADIVSDIADIVEDTPTKLDVLGNDNFEGDAPVVSVEAGHEPTNGTVVVNNDGTVTYTPNQDYNGPDQFTYTVTSGGVTETTTVTLNVTPVNDKPVVENTIADQSLEEDFTPYTIDLNDAFSDVDNADGELTFSVSGNSNIQVSIVDGIATITPTADWNGSEELTFTAEDPSGETVSQVVDFTVAAVADIVSDSADIVEDTPTKLDVLGNDNFEGDAPVVTVEAGHEPTNGTVVVNDDGTITYTPNQDYNGPDQFTYTVSSGGVTETTTVTLNVTPVNDKPLNEDFDHSANELITNVIFDTDDKPLDEGVDSDHISDLEDDLSGDELQIRITELPTSGTLYFKDEDGDLQEITSADGTLYDKDSIYYEADNVGFLLGIKDRPDTPDGAESTTDFYNWGLSADGGESHSRTEYLVNGASIDISSDSGVLAQYNQKVSHIGHGIADNDGQGIQPGETISIDLSENPVGSVHLGLDGLGGLFEHGSNNAALITVTYQDANGAEHTQVIEFLKPEGNSMLFQETSIGYGKDYGLPEGSVITQLDFSTKTSGNWELRYVEGFPPEDSFDYVAVDSGNAESDPATVTITNTNEVLDGNVSEDGPSLTLIGNSVVEGEDITFSVVLDEVTETTVKYSIDMLAQGSSADNADVNLSNVSFTNGITFAGGFLIVPAGVSAFEVIVPSIDDLSLENAEDMVLEIGGESGIATIQDNDSTTLSVSQVGDVNEGSDAVFTVSLSNEVQDPFAVNLKPTTDGSYTAEDADLGQMVVTYIDSQGKNQTLNVTPDGDVTIPAGITSITVTIPTKTDGVYENTESFGLTVTDNGGVTSNGAATGDANIIDAESAPKVSIVSEQASVIEGGDANFTVSIDQKSDEDVVVSFTIGGDVDDKDYQAPTIYTVTIPAGQTSVALDITTLDDGIYEGTENLTITLTDTTGADSTLDAGAKEATVSIIDAQSAPEVNIRADQNNVNEGQTAGFTVTLSQVSDETVTVKFEYTGVAEDGKDFTGIASIEIPAGQSSADLDIATLTDGTYEGAESFTVTIKDVDGADAAIGANDNASVTINDAQQAPTVSIVAEQASVTEGGDANFTVSIDQKSDEDVVVSFTIGGDVDGKDYQAPTIYTVTIPAGQTSVALDVTTLDDGIYEGTENLTITLTDTTGADSTLDADTKEATVSIIDAQKEVLSLQNVVGLEDQFIELGIVVNDGDTSVQTVELNGIPQGSIIEIDGQASIVGSVDEIVVSIDDISSVKVKAPEHSDVNFDIAVIARDDSDTIVETGSIYVDVHPDADKPILNIGGFEQVAAIDFEDVTIKSGSWDSDIEINKVEGAGTVGQWFTSNPGQHVEVGTEGTYLPGDSTNQVMEIEGEVGDKVLYTDMDLVAGRFYNFEFDIAARTNKAHTSDMSVTLIKVDDHGNPIDGSEVVLYDFDPTTHGWHKGESITLPVEESGKYRLLFEADEADSTGAIMDNIKFTAVDNLGYEDSFIKLSEIDASLQDSLDQSESLTVELTGIPVGSVLRDGEGDSANTYVVTQENKDDRIDVTDWDLSNLQVKTQDAGIFAITVIATSTERDTNKDDEHGDHIDVGGSLTAESTASINVEVIDKPTSGGDNNERSEPDYTAGEDMIDSIAYRSGFNDFNWQQSAAYVNAGNPEQNGLYDYDPSSGVSIDVGTGNDKVLMGGGDDIIYLGESHVQVQDGDISDDKFSSVLADFAATELNALTDTFGEQDQHLKIESQSKPGLDIGHGGAGDDVIFGEKGSDIVFGGTGHDTLDGGDGSDAVRGGSGNDVLIGGSGDDILIGDDGEDIFKFVDDGSGIRDGEVDTIKDFTKGEDKIDISDLLHTDDFDSIDSLLANNEIGLEADGDNLILTISESDGSSSQKVVIEGGSNQYSELLSDGSLSPADGSAILNDLLKINNDIT
ncbi:tandem-95 repeat protein [Vibrio campbellii]|uniref:tandem-95 repeat protein n=4 Tax=Vibrio campbellii TaxID=680 RepID=UPI000C9EFC89|nr:Ig-like domain-containing protein [Vibrio campbellii]